MTTRSGSMPPVSRPSIGRRGDRGADRHGPRLLGGPVGPWGPYAPPQLIVERPSAGRTTSAGKGTPESPPLHKETYSVGLFFHRASAAFRARAARCAGL